MSAVTLPLPLAVTAAAEAMALAAKTHPGPWEAIGTDVHDGDGLLAQFGFGLRPDTNEAALCAASRTLVPRLAALVTALAERLAHAHRDMARYGTHDRSCWERFGGVMTVPPGECNCGFSRAFDGLIAPLVIEEGQ